jgi:ParB-like chromosome segregation protein Spo0J
MEKFIYFGVRKHNKWREARGKNWDSWEELASAIKKNGIQKTITVRPVTTPDGTKYAVVNGNHRIVAGHMAGLKEFPCEVI